MSSITGGRSGRGQGEHRRRAEGLDGAAELEIRRPEVVAPLRDAVRFVDHDQIDQHAVQRFEELGLREPFRAW